jgi:hypothetical protein
MMSNTKKYLVGGVSAVCVAGAMGQNDSCEFVNQNASICNIQGGVFVPTPPSSTSTTRNVFVETNPKPFVEGDDGRALLKLPNQGACQAITKAEHNIPAVTGSSVKIPDGVLNPGAGSSFLDFDDLSAWTLTTTNASFFLDGERRGNCVNCGEAFDGKRFAVTITVTYEGLCTTDETCAGDTCVCNSGCTETPYTPPPGVTSTTLNVLLERFSGNFENNVQEGEGGWALTTGSACQAITKAEHNIPSDGSTSIPDNVDIPAQVLNPGAGSSFLTFDDLSAFQASVSDAALAINAERTRDCDNLNCSNLDCTECFSNNFFPTITLTYEAGFEYGSIVQTCLPNFCTRASCVLPTSKCSVTEVGAECSDPCISATVLSGACPTLPNSLCTANEDGSTSCSDPCISFSNLCVGDDTCIPKPAGFFSCVNLCDDKTCPAGQPVCNPADGSCSACTATNIGVCDQSLGEVCVNNACVDKDGPCIPDPCDAGFQCVGDGRCEPISVPCDEFSGRGKQGSCRGQPGCVVVPQRGFPCIEESECGVGDYVSSYVTRKDRCLPCNRQGCATCDKFKCKSCIDDTWELAPNQKYCQKKCNIGDNYLTPGGRKCYKCPTKFKKCKKLRFPARNQCSVCQDGPRDNDSSDSDSSDSGSGSDDSSD